MSEKHKNGEAFERQVSELLAAHGADNLRREVYRLAKIGKLNVKYILMLEEIRRVELDNKT